MSYEDGYYNDAEIIEARIAQGRMSPVMLFKCRLADGGVVEVEQPLESSNPKTREIAKDLAEHLDLTFNAEGLGNIASTIGRRVNLQLKSRESRDGNNVFKNWNIAVPRNGVGTQPLTGAEASKVLDDFFTEDTVF